MSELKSRNRQIKDKKLLNKDEVYHGALEDILLGWCWCLVQLDLGRIQVRYRYCWSDYLGIGAVFTLI